MNDIFDLTNDLGLEGTKELEGVFRRAVEVHVAREEEPPLSRTSLFQACVESSRVLQRVVSANGFIRHSYEISIGMKDTDGNFSIGKYPINDFIAANVRNYAQMWKRRPLDALGLAAVMLVKASAEFAVHLKAAGLSELDASNCALNLFSIIQQEEEQAGYQAHGWPAEAIVPWESVSKFITSEAVRTLLDAAAANAVNCPAGRSSLRAFS
jgi:hypothetical protein